MRKAILALDLKAQLGEGPSWNEKEGLLYWVDITGKLVHTYDPKTGDRKHTTFDRMIGAVVPRRSGGIMMAMEDGFYAYNFNSEQLTFIGNPENRKRGTRFNDGKCDAAGRFWAGTMSLEGKPNQGALYCLEADLTIRTVLDDVSISNGIAWSPDNRTMYYIDSPTRNVMAYDYDLATGQLSGGRVAAEINMEGAVPDGMCCDTEGNIWVALWGGFCIQKWDPRAGELLATVQVPASQSSSCAFGGEEMNELFITSARICLSETDLLDQPHAGGLFKVDAGVRGLPTYAFGG